MATRCWSWNASTRSHYVASSPAARAASLMAPAMSTALTPKVLKALTKNPATVPRYYRCCTYGCAGHVPALRAEQVVRKALDHLPESWSAEDKVKLATYATAFDLMWPINQRRVFGACCASVVWNRKRDELEIRLIPNSALASAGEEGEPDNPPARS